MKLLIILTVLLLVRFVTFEQPFADGDHIRMTGQVQREPVLYDTSRQLHVGGLVMYVPKYPEVKYGDTVMVAGTVAGDTLEDVQILEVNETHSALYTFRESIINFFATSLPEPHASLVSGVSMGSKAGMSEKFYEQLKHTGTAHVVVASGMNVTLVGGFLLSVLIKVTNRRKAIIVILAGIWLYAVAAGFDAPIIRAAIMGSIAFTAQGLGRINDAMRALLISASVMLLINPLWLRDIGFQLSCLATCSLIIFNTKVDRLISFVPSLIRQDLATSIAAQVGVAPLLFIYFGTVNMASPIINALLLWTIPLITIIGMVAGVVSILIPILGKILLLLIYPLTSWFIFIVDIFS